MWGAGVTDLALPPIFGTAQAPTVRTRRAREYARWVYAVNAKSLTFEELSSRARERAADILCPRAETRRYCSISDRALKSLVCSLLSLVGICTWM